VLSRGHKLKPQNPPKVFRYWDKKACFLMKSNPIALIYPFIPSQSSNLRDSRINPHWNLYCGISSFTQFLGFFSSIGSKPSCQEVKKDKKQAKTATFLHVCQILGENTIFWSIKGSFHMNFPPLIALSFLEVIWKIISVGPPNCFLIFLNSIFRTFEDFCSYWSVNRQNFIFYINIPLDLP